MSQSSKVLPAAAERKSEISAADKPKPRVRQDRKSLTEPLDDAERRIVLDAYGSEAQTEEDLHFFFYNMVVTGRIECDQFLLDQSPSFKGELP